MPLPFDPEPFFASSEITPWDASGPRHDLAPAMVWRRGAEPASLAEALRGRPGAWVIVLPPGHPLPGPSVELDGGYRLIVADDLAVR